MQGGREVMQEMTTGAFLSFVANQKMCGGSHVGDKDVLPVGGAAHLVAAAASGGSLHERVVTAKL